MARHVMYDDVFTKHASEELVLSFDLTNWMDSGESVDGDPATGAYDRNDGTDVSSDILGSSNDTIDSDDVFWLYVQGGEDGDDVEIEVNWDTDADPIQNMTMVALLRIRGA